MLRERRRAGHAAGRGRGGNEARVPADDGLEPPAPGGRNVLDRAFDPDEPDASWVADVTDIPTREGWLSVAVVVDLFSRMVVGWSVAATTTSRLVVDALEVAAGRLPDGSSGLVAHSDRGSQYASEHYRRRLSEERITCSVSRRGN